MGERLKLGVDAFGEGRFHRQELIGWWDQALLADAKAFLVGAGALGNELLKNLALVGVGAVLVADMDRVENSNLARCVLFREEDIGQPKAEVAARRAAEIFPGMRLRPLVANVVYDVGMGVFHWADVVLCGLDNREARVAVNRSCMLVGRPWSDGAIERLDGTVRFFTPDGSACYECTMSETDWQMLEARRSCALLSREEMVAGRTPTTATPSSIVAGFQCQQALRFLHGRPVQGGRGLTINGESDEVLPVVYPRDPECSAHERLDRIVELEDRSESTSLADLLGRARAELGPHATLEFSRDIIHELTCPACDTTEPAFLSLGTTTEEKARCPTCNEVRAPRLIHGVEGGEDFLGRTLREAGLPAFDIVLARAGDRAVGFLMAGDEEEVMCGLARVGRPAAR